MKMLRSTALTLAGWLAASAVASAAPNFVVIYGEGAGWSSSSVQMDDRNPASKSAGLKTPNLERLAAGGMRFANGYAASPRCTPSRAALFTGRSPAALHMTFVNEGRGGDAAALARVIAPHAVMELPESATTVGELLQRAGYATAHFGKWHVGRESPAKHGFPENDGANGNGGPENVLSPNPKQALAIAAKGIDFMTRQAKAGRPFYLQMSHYPNQEEKRGGGGGKGRAPEGDAEQMGITDQTLGQVLDAVERLGLKGSTYVLYTTDHGTPGRNPPLTGGKGTVSEGGLRVPFIVAGPGIAAGACSHVRVSATDWLPTVAELAGVKEPLAKEVEGGSFAAVLKGGGQGIVRRSREEFVVHFPHYDKDAIGPASAIYLGDLKLVRIYETGERRLFDLSKDITERTDLAKLQPQKVAELDQRLTDYLAAVNAQMPNVNANVPVGQRPPEKKGKKGKEK